MMHGTINIKSYTLLYNVRKTYVHNSNIVDPGPSAEADSHSASKYCSVPDQGGLRPYSPSPPRRQRFYGQTSEPEDGRVTFEGWMVVVKG